MKEDRVRSALVVILGLSVLARLAAALYLGNEVRMLPGTADQISYHTLAVRVANGHGFTFAENWWPLTQAGEPTAHWSYLYTGLLAGLYRVVGVQPLAGRLIQAVLVGVLHPLLAFQLARRIFGPWVAVLAAGLTACYAYFVYYAAALMTEPLYMTGILASLYLAVRLADSVDEGQRGKYWLAVGLGLALGATVLLRQIFLVVVPIIALWIAWGRRGALMPIGMSAFILIGMILPFTLYNYLRFDQFVLLNTNAGFAFFWANHPVYGTQFVPILPPEMGSYASLIPVELRALNEAALDRALLRRGIEFVVEDPGRYLQLSLSRIPAYFKFWPSPDSSLLSNLARVSSFGLLWPFMLLGTGLSFRRRFQLTSPESLLVGFGVVYTAIHVLSWTLIRYRLPVDAIMILFGAFALVELYRGLEARQSTSRVSAPS